MDDFCGVLVLQRHEPTVKRDVPEFGPQAVVSAVATDLFGLLAVPIALQKVARVWESRTAVFVDLNPPLTQDTGYGIQKIPMIVRHDRPLCTSQFDRPVRLEDIVLVEVRTHWENAVVH